MNKIIIMLLLFLTACSEKVKEVSIKGEKGDSGENGYSLVATSSKEANLCGSNVSGSQITLALDLDRSQSFSEGDLVQTQFITCDGTNGKDGTSCSVQKVGTSSVVTCGEQSVTVNDGLNGSNGQDGLSAYEVWIQLGNQGSESDFLNSLVGPKGDKGNDGQNGLSAYQVWLSLGNSGTEAQFIDSLTGPAGPTGSPGVNASGIFISEFLNPCGVEFANEEVLLKMSNGKVLGLYDGGPNEDRLAILSPGDYITTDRNNNNQCRFTLTSSGNLSNQRLCQGSGNNCTNIGGQ